jgi:serine/threonine protein kinase/tetratricopeptide (TPR) repeat protein
MTGRPVSPGGTAEGARDEAERLYDQARELPPRVRRTFLENACRGNPELEQELVSLLANADAAEELFARMADIIASPSSLIGEGEPEPGSERAAVLPPGTTVGRYRILAFLGAGGMGAVYRARDTRLQRDVALKFLPAHLSAALNAEQRLLVEARAAAALEHPNVCTIHEIGETEEGRPFIAMAIYEGETLTERLRRGPLPVAEGIGVATQIARGLAAAHAHGIVHRDVKPGNIMLTPDGTVKLLDFGLAKVADVSLTGPGVTPGTVAYMSPEQAQGDTVDLRTDLWSLGAVLYEMLTAVRPFRGGNDRAVVQSILHESPAPVLKWRPDVPPALARIMEHLLQKTPAARYANAAELLTDLSRVPSIMSLNPVSTALKTRAWAARDKLFRSRPPTLPPGLAGRLSRTASGPAPGKNSGVAEPAMERAVRHRPRSVLFGAAALSLLALIGLSLFSHQRERGSGPAEAPAADAGSSIAILPFDIRGAGFEAWHEGMVDVLSTNLSGVPGVRTVHSRTVLARWRERVKDAEAADLDAALDVASRTRARYAVIGSVVTSGRGLRLTAGVYDVPQRRMIRTGQVEGPAENVFGLVDQLSLEVLRVALPDGKQDMSRFGLAHATTSSLPALKAYLEGEALFRRSDFESAARAYRRAVEADSTFALAWARLSLVQSWTGTDPPDSLALVNAARFPERLPVHEAALIRAGIASRHGRLSGIGVLQEEVRKYPDDAQAWYLLGEDYQHLGTQALVGREDADRAFGKAVELDPSFAPAYIHLIENAFAWGDSARAARLLEKYRQLAPGDRYSDAYAVAFALAFGDSAWRRRGWADLETLQFPSHLLALWSLLSGPGSPRSARLRGELLRFASKHSDRFALLAVDLFWARIGRGEIRSALQELKRPTVPKEEKVGLLYAVHSWDLPVANELLGSSFSRVDRSDILQVFSQGAYAVDRARWDGHARALSRLRAIARSLRAAADTVRADFADAAARGLEGYGWWRRGEKDKALELLSVAQREATGWEANGHRSREVLNALFRRWLGLLLEEVGKPRDALPYFESFQWYEVDPLAARDRARLHEKLGELDRAREAYAFFIDHWQNTDPELQPRVEEARAALRRLASLRSE